MNVIGISGYARTGKDTVADILVKHGYKKVAYADKLRDAVYTLNPIVSSTTRQSFGGDTFQESTYVQDVIDAYGWDGYKETFWAEEIRRLVQRMGTEVGRGLFYENFWVDALYTGRGVNTTIVVPDCRFPNEADAVRMHGGRVLRIERPGVNPVNDHPSETSLDDYDFDHVFHNDGPIEMIEPWLQSRGYI